jgi:PAP2 superfamily
MRTRIPLSIATVLLALAPAASGHVAGHRASRHDGHPAPRGTSAQRALVLSWYDITNQTVTAGAFAEPATGSRVWSVAWLAAARAAGDARYADYADAAFVQALHDALVAQVPSQQATLDADLASSLAAIPTGPAKNAGIAAGAHQAALVLAARQGDGLDTASLDIPYTPPAPGPGVWQPTPPAFAPALRAGQGKAKPFLLASANQFDPGAPPSLTSPEYTAGLAEVRAYGAANSTVRTPAQTDIAAFWEPAANIQYIQIVRGLIAEENRPLAWDLRLVAAFQVVTTDAQIAIFNAKFEYTFWRPVTAIREDALNPDPSWTPFFATPRYPDWPSGHGGYAGAAQGVLTAFVGPNAPAPISVTSPVTDPGSTHSYQNWSAVTAEVVDARVWEGIHFRFSDEAGATLGRNVANYDLHRLYLLGLH